MFLVLYSLIKCQIKLLLVRLVITRYHQMTTTVYCRQNFMHVKVSSCLCECMCIYMCIYLCVVIKTCDEILSTDTSSKQLYMTCGYIITNKINNTTCTVVGGRT